MKHSVLGDETYKRLRMYQASHRLRSVDATVLQLLEVIEHGDKT